MDDTSLNQFFLTSIAARVGAEEFYERLCSKLEAKCMTFARGMSSAIDLQKLSWPTSSVVYSVFVSSGQSPIPWSFGDQPLITLSGPETQEDDLDG